MEQKKREKQNRLVARVLLLLFLFYFSNISLFQHTHIINGVTVVHSHLHSSHHSDTPTGGHTTNDLTLIAALSGLRMEAAASFEWSEVFLPSVLVSFESGSIQFFSATVLEHAPLRGPPAC